MLVNHAGYRILKLNSIQFNLGSTITLLGECFSQPSAAENNQERISV